MDNEYDPEKSGWMFSKRIEVYHLYDSRTVYKDGMINDCPHKDEFIWKYIDMFEHDDLTKLLYKLYKENEKNNKDIDENGDYDILTPHYTPDMNLISDILKHGFILKEEYERIKELNGWKEHKRTPD